MQHNPRVRPVPWSLAPLALAVLVLPAPRAMAGGDCVEGWSAIHTGLPGTNDPIYALAVFDDGTGPALYAGGEFEVAGGQRASRIARWDGQRWSPLAGEIDRPVQVLCVHDDGSGPALYVGGRFTQIDGVPYGHIARWDGSSWSQVGGGVSDGAMYGTVDGTQVASMRVFDDGGGPVLFVGGNFTVAGGTPVHHVARWDGAGWSAMLPGMTAFVGEVPVAALEVYDDGNGPRLYAAGSLALGNVLRWNGSAWEPLGQGIGGDVLTMIVHDLGTGPQLILGGSFMSAGGQQALRVARWDGVNWSPMATGFGLGVTENTTVRSLAVFDAGSGPELYATGRFTNPPWLRNIARWGGASWEPLDYGLGYTTHNNGYGHCMLTHDDGSGSALYVGGLISRVGSAVIVGLANIGRWDGSAWSQVGSGFGGLSAPVVRAVLEYDDGSGPALYVGGSFLGVAGVAAPSIARLRNGVWSSVGSGFSAGFTGVTDLARFDAGSGDALYAAGSFISSGAQSMHGLARWDGSTWSPLPGGTLTYSGPGGLVVRSLAVHDDGSGPSLFAAGNFTSPVQRLGRWNGSGWSSIGGVAGDVQVLEVLDDGTGPALYAAGNFTSIGGTPAGGIARWDGSTWTALGPGLTSGGQIYALAAYDSGGGPQIHAAGLFGAMGGQPMVSIARWDGAQWHPLGSGLWGTTFALAVHDDGDGAVLYAGGTFSLAGGLAASGIARWNGSAWSAPAGMIGLEGVMSTFVGHVHTLRSSGSSPDPELWVGGNFQFSPAGDSTLTRFTACGPAPAPFCFGDGSGTPCPCGNAGPVGHGCRNSLGLGALLSASGSSGTGIDTLRMGGTRLPALTPCLLLVGTSALQGGSGVPFGDGLRCVGGGVVRLGVALASPAGVVEYGPGLATLGGWRAGDVRRFQVWYRDPLGPCGGGFNFTNGVRVVFR